MHYIYNYKFIFVKENKHYYKIFFDIIYIFKIYKYEIYVCQSLMLSEPFPWEIRQRPNKGCDIVLTQLTWLLLPSFDFISPSIKSNNIIWFSLPINNKPSSHSQISYKPLHFKLILDINSPESKFHILI